MRAARRELRALQKRERKARKENWPVINATIRFEVGEPVSWSETPTPTPTPTPTDVSAETFEAIRALVKKHGVLL
jgi:hypothetical protein